MGPPMSVDLQPDLRPSYLEHRAMRIDAEHLTALAPCYAWLLAAQPLLLRVLYRLTLRPRYDRLARRLRESGTCPSPPGSSPPASER
jgi:hypothetical protein